MPKRFAIGTNLGLFTRRVSRKVGGTPAVKMHQAIQSACFEALETRTLFSTYYVSPTGSNSGPGTLAQPYKTIQEAATIANWGDTVDIETGTYRETVTPAHSGVTFTNYNNESVTIDGTNQVSGFSDYSGSIYVANNSPNLGEGNNMVFVNGQLLNEARYPNTSLNPSSPTKDTVQSYSNNTIYDSQITQGNGYWNGALVSITPGDGWVTYVGVVNSSGPGWLNVSLPSLSGYEVPTSGNSFYLFGKYQALDSAGEYYINSSNQLFIETPSQNNPSSDDVEVQARQWGFNLDGVSNTTIKGISLWACSINTNWSSSNTVINGITASYLGQFANEWGSGWAPPACGIQLYGSGDILENSNIGYSAGDGVYVANSNIQVLNNTIHDVDWSATDAAGIHASSGGVTISGNTIYNCGRDGINFQGGSDTIKSNTIHDFMLQTYDGAGIYTTSNTGGGTIADNTIYNAHKNNYAGLDAAGIMLDNTSSNFTVYGNVTSNVDSGFKANFTSYNEKIYDNEFGAIQHSMETNGWTGFEYSWSGSEIYDNVWYNSSVEYGTGVSAWGNTYSSGSPSITTTPPAPPPPAPASPPPPPPASTSSGSSSGSSSSSSAYPASGLWTASEYWKESNVGLSSGAVGHTSNGSWIEYGGINFSSGLTTFKANVAVPAAYAGQKIEVFLDSLSSSPIAVLTTTSTGSWNTFDWESTSLLSSVSGTHNMYIEFVGSSGIANLMNWQFS